MPIRFSLAVIFLAASTLLAIADAPYPGQPYSGHPQPIPGKIEAESYDVAPGNANGIAYNRKGKPRAGKERTTGDCIALGRIDASHVSTTGVKETPGGIYVGWTDVGDWWNYTVTVPQDGTYTFGAKLAAGAKGAKISVTFLPATNAEPPVSSGPMNVPTTAGFQPGIEVYHVWETLPAMVTLKLAKGLYVMQVKVEAVAGLNIDYYTLTAAR